MDRDFPDGAHAGRAGRLPRIDSRGPSRRRAGEGRDAIGREGVGRGPIGGPGNSRYHDPLPAGNLDGVPHNVAERVSRRARRKDRRRARHVAAARVRAQGSGRAVMGRMIEAKITGAAELKKNVDFLRAAFPDWLSFANEDTARTIRDDAKNNVKEIDAYDTHELFNSIKYNISA